MWRLRRSACTRVAREEAVVGDRACVRGPCLSERLWCCLDGHLGDAVQLDLTHHVLG